MNEFGAQNKVRAWLRSGWICGSIGLLSPLYAVTGMEGQALSIGASSVQSVLKSVSGSVTQMLATTAGVTSSPSGDNKPGVIGLLKNSGIPQMVAAVRRGPMPALRCQGMSPEQMRALSLLPLDLLAADSIRLRQELHPLARRHGDGAILFGNTLWLDPALNASESISEMQLAIGRALYDQSPTALKKKWRQAAGWTRHGLFPLVQTHGKIIPAEELQGVQSMREHFANAVVKTCRGEKLQGSWGIMLRQWLGENSAQAIDGLDNMQVDYVMVQPKGFSGASVGHCSLAIHYGGESVSVSYGARFDWEHPTRSGIRAVVGRIERDLELMLLDNYTNRYSGENREVKLIPLALSNEEKQLLLFRIQECLEYERGDYSFMRRNCANPLRDLLLFAMPDEDKGLSGWHTPLSLERWAQGRRLAG